MPAQEKILCSDWGTSAFRLMLAEASSARVLASDTTDQGIARTFALWQQREDATPDRRSFYLQYIQERIAVLEQQTGSSLEGVPLILSGMASSSMGIEELNYKPLPFAVDGSDLFVKPCHDPAAIRRIFLISGVSSMSRDVMRGEETLLIGSAEMPERQPACFIFPGTHSKHVHVVKGKATALQTFMTGEFFELLTRHSILAHSVSANGHFDEKNARGWFKQGVFKGLRSNLLHSCFSIRINGLFHLCEDRENYYFLSGLLIGSELSALPPELTEVVLVCGEKLRPLYEAALEVLKTDRPDLSYRCRSAEEALVRGQLRIYSFLKQDDE